MHPAEVCRRCRPGGTITALPAAWSSRGKWTCCKVACPCGHATARCSGGSTVAAGGQGVQGRLYRSSRMPRPSAAIAASVGASWMDVKARTCRTRIRATARSTAATSTAGTTTDTCWSLAMVRAAVTENTNTPTATPNVRHTTGSSRNRLSRGERLSKAHCPTRNSSEKMTLTRPRVPNPIVVSASVTRVLATLGPAELHCSSRPSASPVSTHLNCTRPARKRRRGRRNRPSSRTAGCRVNVPGPSGRIRPQ